jgi:hypothetical protein
MRQANPSAVQSLRCVTLTIRGINTRHLEVQDLIKVGTLDRVLADRLEDCVIGRKNEVGIATQEIDVPVASGPKNLSIMFSFRLDLRRPPCS